MSRSTWACELKLPITNKFTANTKVTLHVSVWVEMTNTLFAVIESRSHAPRERVSWNFALRARCQIEEMSRSTWACELKLDKYGNLISDTSHAPRERVSWNSAHWSNRNHWKVTLHVSVWVEINQYKYNTNVNIVTLHVSVWVEMRTIQTSFRAWASHAPRERVSWNLNVLYTDANSVVTLHVSVWVEICTFIYY